MCFNWEQVFKSVRTGKVFKSQSWWYNILRCVFISVFCEWVHVPVRILCVHKHFLQAMTFFLFFLFEMRDSIFASLRRMICSNTQCQLYFLYFTGFSMILHIYFSQHLTFLLYHFRSSSSCFLLASPKPIRIMSFRSLWSPSHIIETDIHNTIHPKKKAGSVKFDFLFYWFIKIEQKKQQIFEFAFMHLVYAFVQRKADWVFGGNTFSRNLH